MSIEGVTSAQIIQKLKGIEESTRKNLDDTQTTERSDKVNISGDARLAQTVERATKAIEDAPEVRTSRVEEVRAKLESGEYDSPEVIERVSDAIADVFLGR